MILAWLNGREAAEIGAALADEFGPQMESGGTRGPSKSGYGSLQQLLRRADSDVRPLRFNFYKKAKFANSFKWRLIERGVDRDVANEVTQSLLLHLSQDPPLPPGQNPAPRTGPTDKAKAQLLFRRGNKAFTNELYAEAAALYREALELDSLHAEAHNNLGLSLTHLGGYAEAEQYFRQAIAIKPAYSEPHGNLGNLLRLKTDLIGAESSLRRALKLRPNNTEARINLGLTLSSLGRLRDARACFAKPLKTGPRNIHALYGMGQLAVLEGRFDEADETFRRIIEIDPKMPKAWAALARTRKMTNADGEWFKNAEKLATSGVHPLEEANLRFSMGKYCDDINDFGPAFQNFARGNELLKTAAEDYDKQGRSDLIDNLIRVYSREAMAKIGDAGSSSAKPVFVLGMPRSGTSLAEQIIASHPAAYGAGELKFWTTLVVNDRTLSEGLLIEPARTKVADDYLRILDGLSANASRVVDKALANSDLLGLIYSVFPNARVIYMQRDPIDTCLSCYFQQFETGLNFTLDLADLAHYYCEHRRIVAHWRSVLPPAFILDVAYEDLVADQEKWSRNMLKFIGLEWHPKCLEFHANERHVITSSAWQVRQRMYKNSVARWRNYEKFIGALKTLRK